MAFSLDVVQDAVLAHLRAEMAQPIIEQAIPGPETVVRDENGQINPYVALQFGDIQPLAGGKSLIGPRGDDYWIGIYCQSIAPRPDVARKMSNRLVDVFLGETFPWAGNVRKRAGYGMFPISTSTGATEAYEFPSFFQLLVQIGNDA